MFTKFHSFIFCIILTRKFCTAKLYCEILHTGEDAAIGEKDIAIADERDKRAKAEVALAEKDAKIAADKAEIAKLWAQLTALPNAKKAKLHHGYGWILFLSDTPIGVHNKKRREITSAL